eukprot:TRINITY_DN1697_c0_g1_i2.p1 TRINITY_DN1697_c0_g1~~TRINITY_DN1697_c0_g1_i2.p1  ORF type:complete len:820 (+),score=137.51 TRINITY_DN1697_c0_g1_i2:48-2507(+)
MDGVGAQMSAASVGGAPALASAAPAASHPAPSRVNATVVDPLADFVVVSEFSEKEGPISRCVLGPSRDRFPIDQFVLRIMSVELSVEGHEKWSVWMDWAAQGVECVIVHFQLSDLYARGYVRPLAIAYLSSYPIKLIRYRSVVLRSLYAAADAMLIPNRIIFRHDIRQRLQDLYHMRQSIIDQKKKAEGEAQEQQQQQQEQEEQIDGDAIPPKPSSSTSGLSLDQIDDSIQELQQLLESMPAPTTESEELTPLAQNSAPTEDDDQARLARIESLQRKNSLYDKYLRNLDELSSGAFSSVARNILDQTLKSLQHQPQVLLHDHITNSMGSTVEWSAAAPASTELCIGPTPIINFHLDSESHFVEAPLPTDAEGEADSDHLVSIAGLLWPSSVIGATQPSPHISAVNFLFAIAQKAVSDHAATVNSGNASVPVSNAGHGKPPTLLELLRGRYSWMKHVLFSLLKGRPLFILAETQNATAVAHVIDLLHSFVPGGFGSPSDRPRIIPWWPAAPTSISTIANSNKNRCATAAISIGGDIKMPHLSWIKLAGVDKRCSLSRVMERYVSIWDWEADTLRAPPYNLDDGDAQTSSGSASAASSSAHAQSSSAGVSFDASIFSTPYLTPQPGGRVLDAMLFAKKGWPSNSTFRAHIHHNLFTEYALKAALYYHVCCLAVPPPHQPSASAPQRLSNIPKSRSMTDIAQHAFPSHAADAGAISGAQPVAAAASLALRERARAAFFLRMNVHEQDAEIIEYLAELVKLQQVQQQQHHSGPTSTDNSDFVEPPLRLDLSPTRLFKNTSGTASSSGSSANSSAAAAIASMMI